MQWNGKASAGKRYGFLASVLYSVLMLAACGTSATQQAGAPPSGSPAGAPPAAVSPAPGDGQAGQDAGKPGAPAAGQAPESDKAKSSVGTAETPAAEPTRLADMSFILVKQGWTVEETAKGSIVWKTTDGGDAWSKASVQDWLIRGIGFADAQQGWSVGKSDCKEMQGQRLCSRLRIAYTKDGGGNWSTQLEQKVKEISLYTEDRVFAVNPSQAYAIAVERMFMTGDGGRHWNELNFHIGPFLPEQASFDKDGKHGWVMGRAGKGCKPDQQEAGQSCAIAVVKTSDGGAHWKLQWSPQDSTGQRTVGISFINPSKGWMMILNMENLQSSLYGTTDGGTQWTKLSEMRGGRPYTRGLQFVSETTGFVPLSAGAGPIGGGLAVTRDGGKTFEREVPQGKEWSFEQLQFFNEREGWVRVSDPSKGDYLVYTADAGKQWKTSVPAVK
ncbi:hypothetical protein O9H85_20110 [Paenibacillus filicis]|uniref:Photosynthesis system II assembly factor Ycf48/Hcf136-like domain-containing protein n=1 Tax=Paenibacillus gyeongsangnamensis TaxID=3388067 RepID=A0ABT4QCS7_9BACL|nr:hypothetical protein [Paenibacillus filicis]MCZ8514688.1 hypothetical protein [Paenibacillus filicis]